MIGPPIVITVRKLTKRIRAAARSQWSGGADTVDLVESQDQVEDGRLTGGAITIDGQNVAAISRTALRQQIAYVGQDAFLFHATIRDNIRLGWLGASDLEIIAAAKAAHAHDFITGLSAGYDTPVGEHGLKLSGGERQRIAIARALIKNAPIILLDKATAALDSESEHHVQQAIAELCTGRTTLVIAHRLSTIMHADRILVLEAGDIVEWGEHDELLRAGGRYAAFYNLQLRRQERRSHSGNAGEPATSDSIVRATFGNVHKLLEPL